MSASKITYIHNPKMAEVLRRLAENKVWLISNRENLAKEFEGQHVAVYQGGVVDSDKDEKKLEERLRKTCPTEEYDQICVGLVEKEKPFTIPG
jgi:hypothetical protein